eukprot:757026-Hanusia_phi.AAC.4
MSGSDPSVARLGSRERLRSFRFSSRQSREDLSTSHSSRQSLIPRRLLLGPEEFVDAAVYERLLRSSHVRYAPHPGCHLLHHVLLPPTPPLPLHEARAAEEGGEFVCPVPSISSDELAEEEGQQQELSLVVSSCPHPVFMHSLQHQPSSHILHQLPRVQAPHHLEAAAVLVPDDPLLQHPHQHRVTQNPHAPSWGGDVEEEGEGQEVLPEGSPAIPGEPLLRRGEVAQQERRSSISQSPAPKGEEATRKPRACKTSSSPCLPAGGAREGREREGSERGRGRGRGENQRGSWEEKRRCGEVEGKEKEEKGEQTAENLDEEGDKGGEGARDLEQVVGMQRPMPCEEAQESREEKKVARVREEEEEGSTRGGGGGAGSGSRRAGGGGGGGGDGMGGRSSRRSRKKMKEGKEEEGEG